MKLYSLIVSLAILLFSCAPRSPDTGLKVACIDGVEYIINGWQLAPHFRPDGSLYLCNEQKVRAKEGLQ